MTGNIKKYFSSPFASWSCFLLAVAIKVGLIRSFLEMGNDLLLTIVTTNHWLQGHGISVHATTINDLSLSKYLPYTGWPPGIHLHLAPLFLAVGGNHVLAVFLLMMIISILFFWILRELLLFIGFPIWLANIFLIFQSFTLGRMLLISNPTDYIGLVYLLGGLLFTCKSLQSSNTLKWNLLSVLFLVLAGLCRYQYMPVVMLVGAATIVFGFLNKKNNWIRTGVLQFLFCIGVVIGVQAFFVSQGEADFFLSPIKRGFYPGNLGHTYPFMLSSMLNVEMYSIQVSKILQLPYELVIGAFIFLSFVLLFLFVAFIIYFFSRTRGSVKTNWEAFLSLGGTVTLATIGLIILLSFVLGTQLQPLLGNWTFVMDARYFAFPVLFIQILLWKILFADAGVRYRTYKRIMSGVVITLALIGIIHGTYVLTKKMQGLVPLEELPFKEEEIAFVRNAILQHEQSGKSTRLVFTGVNKLVCYVANWYGCAALYDPLVLNNSVPFAAGEAELIVGIRKRHKEFLKQFLLRKDISLVYSSDQFEFYRLIVLPK